MGDVIDLRDQGELAETGAQLAQALGGLVGRLDPDHPLRKVIFPASRQERVARKLNEQYSVQQEVTDVTEQLRSERTSTQLELEKMTQELDFLVQFEQQVPASERASIQAQIVRTQGIKAELEGMGARRDIDVLEAYKKTVEPEEAAVIQAAIDRASGNQALATSQEATEAVEFRQWLRLSGLGPKQQAEIAAAEGFLKSRGIAFSNEQRSILEDNIRNASVLERELIAVDPQYWAQYLLQREAFSNDEALRRIGTQTDPMKTLQEEWLFKEKIRLDNERITGRLNDLGENGDKDEIDTLVAEMRDNASTLRLIDPMLAVQTAKTLTRFGRPVDAEFMLSLSEEVGVKAQILNDLGGATPANLELLQQNLGPSGIRHLPAILQLAEQMKNTQMEDSIRLEAANEALATRGDVVADTARQERIAELEAQWIQSMDDGTNLSPKMQNAWWEIRKLRLVTFFSNPTTREATPQLMTPAP